MRRGAGVGLSVLGAFLVVVAVLALFYAPGRLAKAPIDTDSVTRLSGTASVGDGSGGLTEYDVRATSKTLADSARSNGDVVSYISSSCLFKDEGEVEDCVSAEDPEDRLLTASTDSFATDRRDALAVNDPKYVPAGSLPHEGLINKWPFDAEKKTYPYWDGVVGEAVDANYDRAEKVGDTEVYVYVVSVADQPAEVSDGVQGTYTDNKEIWIEPVTGSIVHQIDQQERLDADGNTFLTLDLAFTDDQRETNAEDAQASADSLNLVRSTVPLIGLVVGIPALLIGLFLVFSGRRRTEV